MIATRMGFFKLCKFEGTKRKHTKQCGDQETLYLDPLSTEDFNRQDGGPVPCSYITFGMHIVEGVICVLTRNKSQRSDNKITDPNLE